MDNIELDIITSRKETCSLDKACFNERVEYIRKELFSKSTSFTQEKGRIKVSFTYSSDILHKLTDFIDFENGCCNDFIMNMHIDMKLQIVNLEIM